MNLNTSLTTFAYGTTTVRTITKDGEPWFVLKDVCDVLEISNSRDVKDRLREDVVDTADIIDSLGRTQSANIVNESGLYDIIFQSRTTVANLFKSKKRKERN